jgi:hypothetical protein
MVRKRMRIAHMRLVVGVVMAVRASDGVERTTADDVRTGRSAVCTGVLVRVVRVHDVRRLLLRSNRRRRRSGVRGRRSGHEGSLMVRVRVVGVRIRSSISTRGVHKAIEALRRRIGAVHGIRVVHAISHALLLLLLTVLPTLLVAAAALPTTSLLLLRQVRIERRIRCLRCIHVVSLLHVRLHVLLLLLLVMMQLVRRRVHAADRSGQRCFFVRG